MTSQASPSEGETPPPGEITTLLRAAEAGDGEAVDRLFSAVYAEMRRLARRELRASGLGATLNTTALVHEAYLKLSGGAAWSVRDRYHFYATTARAMRQILLDDARRRLAEKRGAGRAALSLEALEGEGPAAPDRPEELLALQEALDRLQESAPELARVVEWRFYAGLSEQDIAEALEVSERTVRRQWRVARAFLYDSLAPSAGGP